MFAGKISDLCTDLQHRIAQIYQDFEDQKQDLQAQQDKWMTELKRHGILLEE